MANMAESQISKRVQGRAAIALVVLAAFWLGLGTPQRAQAQAYPFAVLHSFTGPDGQNPFAALVRDTSGNLYGTTQNGGSSANCQGGCGTVFKLDTSGNLTVLHNFTGPKGDGANPYAGLTMDASGNLYGTTAYGGSGAFSQVGYGTVFKLDSSGSETVLHSFNAFDGQNPDGPLIMDTAGNLYGTTRGGGASVDGTVFRLDTSGNLTVLHSFVEPNLDGKNPYAGLTMDASGNLYGTTANGGSPGNCPDRCGTVFKLDISGNLTVLHSFTGSSGDGAYPYAGLIMDSSGNLYGTTSGGGAPGYGIVFKLDVSGNETVLYSFSGSDGANPYADLVMDSSGNLYGVTSGGGAFGAGIVFKLDTSGHETVLHTFTNSGDGGYPFAGLIIDSSNNLYGTTSQGGAIGGGTVFKVGSSPCATPVATTTLLTSSPNPASAGDSVTFTATVSAACGTATGSVAFSNGSMPLGTSTLSFGQTGLTIEDADSFGIGAFAISAQYQPDTSAFNSSSAAITQTVNEVGVALTNGNNAFSGNQTVNGSVTATSFVGNGSALTGITASNANTANTANFATSAGTAATATNALALGGLAAGYYARLDIDNSFSGNQSVAKNLSVSGNSATTGTVTIGSGGTPITGHLSALANPTFPALKPGDCATANFTLAGAANGDTIALGVPNERMTGGGNLIYTAWVSAPNTVTIQGCNAHANKQQKTAGSGNIRIDLWKH